jgi:SAM-dependent methyltransferase
MLELARVTKNDVVYDLGSGDGRIVIEAARRFGARGVGVEIDPDLVREARRNAEATGVGGRVRFRHEDMFKAEIRDGTVVTLFILQTLNERLRPKLLAELRPGTRVVSHAFDMGDWEPDSIVSVKRRDGGASPVYLWIIPASVAGTWELTADTPQGDRRYELRLRQRYQKITATATAGGRVVAVPAARLAGDRISFRLTDTVRGRHTTLRFVGHVGRDGMNGRLTAEGGERRDWTARRVATAAR